jgi:phosphoglycolate phosphatase
VKPDKPALVALDLDGTLVDSAPDIAYAVDRALESAGFAPPGESATRLWIGDGVETLIARALANVARRSGDQTATSPETFRRVLDAFLATYGENVFVRSTLYPGVRETLERLARYGLKLCCITNKRSGFSEALLERAEIRHFFELVIGGDSLPEKKPSPLPLLHAAETLNVPPDEAVLVGDSHQDLRAARAAGYEFVFVEYGYGKGKVSEEELGSTPRVTDFAALAPLFRC